MFKLYFESRTIARKRTETPFSTRSRRQEPLNLTIRNQSISPTQDYVANVGGKSINVSPHYVCKLVPKDGREDSLSRFAGYRRLLAYGIPLGALTRDIWMICLSCTIGAFGEGLYFWIFPLYIRQLQADYVQLGLVYSVLLGVSALVSIAGGLLADRCDRKKLLILGWAFWIFAPLIYSFAIQWSQLIPGAIFWGASNIAGPAVSAYVITAVTDKKRVASVVTFVFSTFTFSYIFAPAVGGYLATIAGMRFVLYVSTILILLSTCVLLFVESQHPSKNHEEEHHSPPVSSEKQRLWRKLLLWSTFFTLITFFMSLARNFVPVFLSEQAALSEFHVGLFGSVNFAGITFVGIALGRLSDRWKKSGAISIALLLFIVSMVPILIVHDTTILMFLAFVYGGSAVIGSLVSSLVGTIAPEARRGLWLSIPQSLSLLAAFAAPYLGGFLYSYSPYYAFIVSIVATPFLLIFSLFALKD
jgi:MFS family permease